jgi:nanoRNase/pAp phosphatase (c-di-AMP/oligoRNAs hydrolase)
MRLVTRSDFDGLACAALLAEAGVVDRYEFVHPKDVRDGKVVVDKNSVLANIPYVPGCGLWFDHHSSELERVRLYKEFKYRGRSELAPSCARVVYNYYGGAGAFSRFDETGMMAAVDKSDSGRLTRNDINHPAGWVLLSFIMDPRTGLGRFKDYRVSNYQLMENMIDFCRTRTVEDILEEPDVRERTGRYFQQEKAYEEMLKSNTVADDNVLIINLLDVDPVLPGNRFKEYVLFPKQTSAMRILWGCNKENIVFTCGHSILKNRESRIDIGALMAKYGGGGHSSVGACQVPSEDWPRIKEELTTALKD